MKKKLTGIALALTAVFALVLLVSPGSITRAQESGPEEGTAEEADCPPDMCYSYATSKEEEDPPEDTRGTCTCGIFYDADCHYEYVSAFQCLPWRHNNYDIYDNEEWEAVHDHDNYWGVRKDDSGSGQLELICPIPTDRGSSSIKYYGDVGQVKGYFYHYNSSYPSAIYVYSAKANDVDSHGGVDDSTAGHRTLTVTPSGSYFYSFWYARIEIANHVTSSFHGLEICFDPD